MKMLTDDEVRDLRREIAVEVFEDLVEWARERMKHPPVDPLPLMRLSTLKMRVNKTGLKIGRHCRINLPLQKEAV